LGKTIFWSWQSDLDSRVTRQVIREALNEAVKVLSVDLEEADRPSVTSDTQGVAGTPDIVATILRKIDEAAIFVGDVTPIAVSSSGKACANPNVLLEMGYANKALTEHRVIQIWNTAFEGATIDKLPFDMRGRRGPLSFNLPVDADTNALRTVRDNLAKELAAALELALNQLPPPPPDAVHWQPHFQDEPDVWFDRNKLQVVNNLAHGTSQVLWKRRYPGYARIIPSKWQAHANAKQMLASDEGHPALLASPNELSYGISKGGAMVYWPKGEEDGSRSTVALTQWFEKTGEIWGVGGGFLFQRDDDRLTLATGYFYQRWLRFLERNCGLVLAHGGSLPIHVRLGVSDIRDSWWPRSRFQFPDEGYASVEDSYEYSATLKAITPDALQQVAVEAFNGLAAMYGIEPRTHEQIIDLSRY
jgi:hypothetical protein